MRRLSTHSGARTTWFLPTGTMPSPGRTRTFLLDATAGTPLLRRAFRAPVEIGRLEPGRRRPLPGLVIVDRLFLLHGQPDIVIAIEQAIFAERVDVEFDAAAVGAGDLLLLEIDGDDRVGAALGIVHQLVDILLRQLDRQDAVLEAVVVE